MKRISNMHLKPIHTKRFQAVLIASSFAVLTACGGGGGGDASSEQSSQSQSQSTAQTIQTSTAPLEATDTNSSSSSKRTVVAKTALGNCSDFQDKAAILKKINAARSVSRTCTKIENGTPKKVDFKAAKPVTWNDTLGKIAVSHTENMANAGVLSHSSTVEGQKTLGQRLDFFKYNFSAAGENLAGGLNVDYDAVIDGWIKSTSGHCETLMGSNYTEVGGACMTNTKSSDYPTMWTLNFGTPR